MEFNEKLQELRKKRGLTQEELADTLHVSRTAVSKWESGRGYPNIDSLKDLARFFGVTLDTLLSKDELLRAAEDDFGQKQERFRDLVFGLLDIGSAILVFLPLFASRVGGVVESVSLVSLTGISPYLMFFYYMAVASLVLSGVATLALQNCTSPLWKKIRRSLSVVLNLAEAILFVASLQPYAATFLLFILAVKVLLLLKGR